MLKGRETRGRIVGRDHRAEHVVLVAGTLVLHEILVVPTDVPFEIRIGREQVLGIGRFHRVAAGFGRVTALTVLLGQLFGIIKV